MDHRGITDFPKRVGDRVITYVTRKDDGERETDVLAIAVFAAAISALIIACCYVVSRLARERAYRDKWEDYDDCGWA